MLCHPQRFSDSFRGALPSSEVIYHCRRSSVIIKGCLSSSEVPCLRHRSSVILRVRLCSQEIPCCTQRPSVTLRGPLSSSFHPFLLSSLLSRTAVSLGETVLTEEVRQEVRLQVCQLGSFLWGQVVFYLYDRSAKLLAWSFMDRF